MKRFISIALAFVFILCALTPVFAQAKDLNNDEGMFEVDVPVDADAYMLVSLDDEVHTVMAQKNKDVKKYPASLTKIVTAMVTLENVSDLQKKVTVSQKAIDALANTDAQVAGLTPGEEISFEQLVYLTMIYSACDACQVLAENVGGSVKGFTDMMNDYAKKCGCKNTHFVNPDGLHDDNHYTTASDMMLITLTALKNKKFNEVCSVWEYEYNGKVYEHTNYMLVPYMKSYYYAPAQGIKTGSTKQAGYCVITKAQKNGRNYLAIIMDSSLKDIGGEEVKCSFTDAKALFEWAFEGLEEKELFDTSHSASSIPVLYGKDVETLELNVAKTVSALVPKAAKQEDFEVRMTNAPKSVEAPVKAGDKICDADIVYKGKIVAKTTLVAADDVKLDLFAKIFASIANSFKTKPVLSIFVLLLIIALIVFAARVIHIKNVKKKRAALRAKKARQRQLSEKHDYYDI